jgi:hypothetical protein
MRRINHYEKRVDVIENRFHRLRNEIEKELRPFVKKQVMALKHDCVSTQHSFCVHDRKHETKRFDTLQDFLNRCTDDFRIDFYFEVLDGKFTWYS